MHVGAMIIGLNISRVNLLHAQYRIDDMSTCQGRIKKNKARQETIVGDLRG